MARIVFVPRWLKETLAVEKIPLCDLVDKPLNDVIPNRQDVLTYLMGQLDLAKFIATSPCPISVEIAAECNHKAIGMLFKDNWPADQDEVKYRIGMNNRIPDFELVHLDPDAADLRDVSFSIEMHDQLPVIFVVGREATDAEREAPEIPAWKKSVFLMRDILAADYQNQRIHVGNRGFSDVVNQNETLLSFYVRDLAFL